MKEVLDMLQESLLSGRDIQRKSMSDKWCHVSWERYNLVELKDYLAAGRLRLTPLVITRYVNVYVDEHGIMSTGNGYDTLSEARLVVGCSSSYVKTISINNTPNY